MRKIFEIGGVVAAAVLIVLGVVTLVMGINGRSTVLNSLKAEQISGSPDMTPAAIAAEAKKAGLKDVALPTCSVAGKAVNNGETARCFAQYMRIHTLEATGGLVYAQMGRFQAKPGAPVKFTDGQGATSDPAYAVLDPKTQQPVENGKRNIWVTETALTTALNSSYMADRIALFGLMVGIVLLLTGFGFGILAIGGALRTPQTAFSLGKLAKKPAPPVPAA
jgi:hypothetical protein